MSETKNKTKKNTRIPGQRRKFGTVIERPDGTFEGRYTFDGKRTSIYAKTYDEIDAQLSIIEGKSKLGEHREGSSMLLKDWLEHWLKTYAKGTVRFSTYSSYEGYLLNHVAPMLGNITLKSLTGEHIQKFFNKKAEGKRLDGEAGGLSPKTLRNMRNALSASFNQAVYNGLMLSNPTLGVKLPKDEHKEMRVLSENEMYAVIKAAQAAEVRWGCGVVLALYTGIRVGELLGLRWQDVDLAVNEPSIIVKKTLTRQKKPPKNDSNYEIISWEPGQKTAITLGNVKTQRSRRKIYLPDPAAEALRKIKDWQNKMKLEFGATFNSNGFVVCSLKGDAFEPRTFQDNFAALIKLTGIDHASCHAMRHTFATRGCEFGVDIATMSSILGHAQGSTTLNMYVHPMDEQKRKAKNVFSSMK